MMTKSKRPEHFVKNACFIPQDKVITLLELLLNNCAFYIQGNFYQQLQRVAMVFPVSPAINNIYKEYFEDLALGSECPLSTSCWKRSVYDIISIVKKEEVETSLIY